MKHFYLILTVIGFTLPTILVVQESIETGNILLYANPIATIKGMFANRISSIFAIDLLFAVVVFFMWTYRSIKQNRLRSLSLIWGLTLLLGMAGGFPLYLYLRERAG